MNYLRPDIKRGNITPDEEDLIIRMHSLLGNRWSLIAKRLPGRTDNEIKNYWNSHLSKRVNNGPTRIKPAKQSNDKLASRGRKKRNSSSTATTSEMIELGKKQSTAMVKVHQPKAVRVSSFSIMRYNSFDNGHGWPLCSPLGARGGPSRAVNYVNVQSVLEYDDQPYEDYLCDTIDEGDPSHSSCDLKRILEEYQQLVKGDDSVQLKTVADSLLI